MSPESLDRLENLFREAQTRAPEEREAFLALACGDDAALKCEIEALLEADAQADVDGFLSAPVLQLAHRPTRAEEAGAYAVGPFIEDRQVGQYRIVDTLGGGGMGVVYKARDLILDRTVALKFIASHLGAQPTARERFMQEAKAASALDHPNVATIFEIGEYDGHLFLAMACIEGENLKEKISRGPLPIKETLSYARQMAEGLQAAHEAGIIHRDVKPANVIVSPRGLVKLLDFGIAKVANSDLTLSGMRLGTVAYMSPEQARGDEVDHRSDIWSLGAVIYEMLTGSKPFRGEHEQVILYAIRNSEPLPPASLRSGVSAALETLVLKMLSKEPALRYQSLSEVLFDLQSLDDHPGEHRPSPEIRTAASRSLTERRDAARTRSAFGRDRQLKVLHERLEIALSGTRQIVFLTGDAGLGKTTIVQEFLREVRDETNILIGRGQCLEHRGPGEPYMPMLEALGRLCREPGGGRLKADLERYAPTWLIQMPALVSAERSELLQNRVRGVTRERMLREMVELLEIVTRVHPLVLVFEDLHWSDYSTIDLLSWLARRDESARLLIVGTYRPADIRAQDHPLHAALHDLHLRGPAFEIPVPLLLEEDVASLLEAHFGSSRISDDVIDLAHSRTEGHPLFLQNLINHWLSTERLEVVKGELVLRGDPREITREIPESLWQMIDQRLERLTPEDRHLLETASVIGVSFAAAALSAAMDLPQEEVEDRLEVLAKTTAMLRSSGAVEQEDHSVSEGYEFVHQLYAEHLHRRISVARRVRLHRQVGSYLESIYGTSGAEHAGELAVHFIEGREWSTAVRYLRIAAEQAFRRNAHRDAIVHLRRAIELLQHLSQDEERMREEVMLHSALGSALIMTEGWSSQEAEAAFVHARRLSDLLGGGPHFITALYGLAMLREFRGQYEGTQRILEELLEAPAEKDGSLLVESHELMACSFFHQGSFRSALDHANTALRIFEEEAVPVRPDLICADPQATSHCWAALALWFMGFPDLAAGKARLALQLSQHPERRFGLADVHLKSAVVYHCRRDADAVLEHARAVIDLSRTHGFKYRTGVGMIYHGWVQAQHGRFGDGLEQIREGLDIHASTGSHMDRPYYLSILAEACARAGRVDEALSIIADACEMTEETRSFFFEPELHRLRGEIGLLAGIEADIAEEHFNRALSRAREQESRSLELRSAVSLAALWSSRGDDERGRRLVQPIYESFTEGFETRDLKEAASVLA